MIDNLMKEILPPFNLNRDMEFLKSKKFWKIFIIAFLVGVIIGGVLEYIKLTS